MPAYPTLTTLGDLLYGGASGVETRLPGNVTTGLKFLRSVGDGSAGAAPSWETVDIASVSGLTDALSGKETAGAADELAATLGDLAVLDSLTKSDVGLGNVSNDAQLKIASNLSDLANAGTARTNLGFGDVAVLNNGSGNGIDADKLDGYEAAAFAKLANDNTFSGAVAVTQTATGANAQLTLAMGGSGFNLKLQNTKPGGTYFLIGATSNATGTGGNRLIVLDGTASSSVHSIFTILSGNFGFGKGNYTPTAVVDVLGDTLRLRNSKTIASAASTGNAGDICWDSNYLYVCVATNTWKRVAIATW